MKTGFTIKLQREQLFEGGRGYATYTLADDNKFYLACNNARLFRSLTEARKAFHNLTEHFKGTDYTFIKGPRNGTHRVGSRHSV